jgi:hypothetical protein
MLLQRLWRHHQRLFHPLAQNNSTPPVQSRTYRVCVCVRACVRVRVCVCVGGGEWVKTHDLQKSVALAKGCQSYTRTVFHA